MSKRTITIPVSVEFELNETGTHPAIEGVAHICATGKDGQEWKTQVKYGGNTENDVIRTLTRMDHFNKAIAGMAMAASPVQVEEVKISDQNDTPDSFEALSGAKDTQTQMPPQETKEEAQQRQWNEQREKFYKELHGDLQKKSYAELRLFVQSNNINMPIQNGRDMKELADEICQALRDNEDRERNEKN